MKSLLFFAALLAVSLAVEELEEFDPELRDLTAYAQHLIDERAQQPPHVVYHHVTVAIPVILPPAQPVLGPYDSRHYMELQMRDRQIAKLSQENNSVQQKLNATLNQLEQFHASVSKEHGRHLENMDLLNPEIRNSNKEIAALHDKIKSTTKAVFSTHRRLLKAQKTRNDLGRILERISGLYDRLYARMTQLHATINREHERSLRGLEWFVAGLGPKTHFVTQELARNDEDEKRSADLSLNNREY